MPESIELNVPPTLEPVEVGKWLAAIALMAESNDGPLAMDVVTDAVLDGFIPNEDWVSIKILLGRCPGRNDPPITLQVVERVDPAPDMKTVELTVEQR